MILYLVTASTSLGVSHAVSAADETTPTRGLTLSPIRNELEIAPGRSLDRTLKLVNYSDKTMTIHLSAEKFSVTNPEYDYAFTAESDTAKWVSFVLSADCAIHLAFFR
ncbi:MAG: hypothetical protein AAB834_03910, partial [Patescibacteria group bacterium]